MTRLVELVRSFDRSVHFVDLPARPAVFYLADREAGGILVNTPAFAPQLLAALEAVAPPRFVFLPSRFGAVGLEAWREAGLRLVAHGAECAAIPAPVDIVVEPDLRFTRTIDFLPMPGRTPGSCALRCRNKPGFVFFGPILDYDQEGRLSLQPHGDDADFDARLLGALALGDARFEYGFCDSFRPGHSRYGPAADQAVRAAVESLLGE
jgi:glyoxylase-like metal-dependent hydrolase (beta-lactamase superfamily II)